MHPALVSQALKRVLLRTIAAASGPYFGDEPVDIPGTPDDYACPPVPVYLDGELATVDLGDATGPDIVIGETSGAEQGTSGTTMRILKLAVYLTTPRDELQIPGLRQELEERLNGVLLGTAPDDPTPGPRQHPLAAKMQAQADVSPALDIRIYDLPADGEPVKQEPQIDPSSDAVVTVWQFMVIAGS